ncbi:MAG: 50S ribosomal protein P1 [Candidatus Diapherotrites archaeon]|uniref:Large ribosomal subunit protein P1 n=1 Tax=Candidatus Iainarchaeum sp. TaxID=3101447 RepID=A0A7J4K004_9ARCH|nr:MAG: large subunit ribosomal protein L12 [archaeon GW2011_AR21]MBS3058782.1 50S ribosomal protein P1 [Candidatus Diapherotrites archaeon]HIH21477.1 50S ribosomal protein P1 [Candidatus Diapherotrites archaeon]HIH33202.1 50S ribosomal protein P1 [Candidatus Diapherotrites archaeon]
MEYVYSAMLLHSAKQEISEDKVSAILKSAGLQADSAKVKALVASLKGVNIDEAIKQAAVQQVVAAPAAAPAVGAKAAEKKEEDSAKAAEAAAEGLGSLFG